MDGRAAEEIVAELVAIVRDQIGPVAAFRHVAIVDRLPKTRSGKVVRATLREIADGKDWTTPATIDDPAILTDIEIQLGHIGYASRRAG